MNSVVDGTGYVVKKLGPTCSPLFREVVLPAVISLMVSVDPDLVGNALLTALDLVEHGGNRGAFDDLVVQICPVREATRHSRS